MEIKRHQTHIQDSFFSDIRQRRRCVICTLSSSDIRAYEVYEAYDVYTKQTLHIHKVCFSALLHFLGAKPLLHFRTPSLFFIDDSGAEFHAD